MRQALTMMVNFPAIGAVTDVPEGLAGVRTKGVPLLMEILELTKAHPGMTPGALVERFRDRPEGPHLSELLVAPLLISEASAPRELADSLKRIVALGRDERMAELVSKAEHGGLTQDEKDEFRRLQRDVGAGIR